MSMKYARMSNEYESTLENFNYAFAAIFNFEAIVKIVGQGRSYFHYAWNKFDLLIVIGTDVGLLMNIINMGINISTVATVVRAFRIMRIFRLVKSSQNMRIILDTIVHIIPQVTNIMSLVFLLLFIYSALGLNLFSEVMYQNFYNDRANFRTFGDSILLLLRCLTGEDWNEIMKELTLSGNYNGDECQSDQTYEDRQIDGIKGCGTDLSYIFFISFMILLSMIIMNLSVAAVIEGLAEASKENMGIVSGDQIDILIDKWKDYDTNASGLISYKDFIFLLYEVPPPLGLGSFTSYYSTNSDSGNSPNYGDENDEKRDDLKNINNLGLQDRYMIHETKRIYIKKSDAIKIFNDYAIPLYDQNVHFKDVAKALIEKIFKKNKLSYDLTDKISKRLKKQWEGKYTTLKKFKVSLYYHN